MDQNEDEIIESTDANINPKIISVNLDGDARTVNGMYQDWFLDYASYVILERAVPHINDGLKPVQRRILHAMKELDDGRYNKVANIIGHTMQYHPHGDAAIGDAIINLGQKNLLIDCQGNWGDSRTGDSAAAPRYIEARLTKFALEVAFNKQTTEWQKSYDGRKNEPITLPMKFPLLLAQGVEGIAVGLSTKILPHNFCELIKGSIDILKGKTPTLYPDFENGGKIDVTDYNDGKRGGRVKVRCTIEERDKNTLIIKDVPYGVTTGSIIDSILKANDKGKIKIKKVMDNTAKEVEIEIQLPPNTSTDKTIDALYAFTNCESSIAPNACVIVDKKPHFLNVSDILRISTHQTVDLLKQELEIKKNELEEKWHFSSLEKIFIENRIYIQIEECETWEAVLETIDTGLKPFTQNLRRAFTTEDIVRLTEIRIKRISKFDAFKADELLIAIEEDLAQVNQYLDHLTEYAIDYFSNLLEKYGKGRERKTEISNFEQINTQVVAVANEKLYVNRKEGFAGTSLKKDEYICDCSDIDLIIVFLKDGKYIISQVSPKAFFGKDIEHIAVFKKDDERTTYNAIYFNGKNKASYAKRFNVTSFTKDKWYDVTKGDTGSKLLYFTANPNGEAEVVNIYLNPAVKAKKKLIEFNFADITIKGRTSQGNTATKYTLRKIELKEKGKSTIGGRDIWYEKNIGRLNVHERGDYLGNFNTDDKILVIFQSGEYEITNHELTNHYQYNEIYSIEKFNPKAPVTVVHYDGNNKNYYVKRFLIETSTLDKKFAFITEGWGSKMALATTVKTPVIQLITKEKDKDKKESEINLKEFIEVKGWKSLGNKLCGKEFVKATLIPQENDEWETTIEDQNEPIQNVESIESNTSENPVTLKELTPKSGDEITSKPTTKDDKKDDDSDDEITYKPGDQLKLL